MGNLEKIIYSPLAEEAIDNVTGWCKETVDYVLAHRNKVERQIRGIARGYRKHALQQLDVEDIYGEVLLYLYNCHDYDLNRAIDRSSSGAMVSLEGYLNVCIKYCVIRYCTQLTAHERETVSDTIQDDNDKELSIFNTIPDPNAEINLDHMVYDVGSLCKSCEPLRYRFGPDIYLILYVRLLTASDISGNTYRNVLDILGISKKDLSRIDRNSDDSVMNAFAKAISITPTEEAISIIEKYVYCAQMIKNAVSLQMA